MGAGDEEIETLMPRLLIIGNPQPTHVGLHFLEAAKSLSWEVVLMDLAEAYAAPVWVRRACWHLLGHRPARLGAFSAAVVERCRMFRPDCVLVTGIAPVSEAALKEIATMGILVANFLTDDPWNRQHRAPWFMRALPRYRHVFTPRHANEADLRAHGVKSLSYLPFAYAPEDHHPPASLSDEERSRWSGLVAFIGGADADRVAMVRVLVRARVPVGLWGGYWKEQPDLAAYAHGHADAETCRKIVAAAGANLCLVRRANRDGHSMRSYEMPAIGGLLLVEDTPDHRTLFGPDGEAVLYFTQMADLAGRASVALAMTEVGRELLRQKARQKVVSCGNTYAERLEVIRHVLTPRLV
jgi:spore maturation protein CgeB